MISNMKVVSRIVAGLFKLPMRLSMQTIRLLFKRLILN